MPYLHCRCARNRLPGEEAGQPSVSAVCSSYLQLVMRGCAQQLCCGQFEQPEACHAAPAPLSRLPQPASTCAAVWPVQAHHRRLHWRADRQGVRPQMENKHNIGGSGSHGAYSKSTARQECQSCWSADNTAIPCASPHAGSSTAAPRSAQRRPATEPSCLPRTSWATVTTA